MSNPATTPAEFLDATEHKLLAEAHKDYQMAEYHLKMLYRHLGPKYNLGPNDGLKVETGEIQRNVAPEPVLTGTDTEKAPAPPAS